MLEFEIKKIIHKFYGLNLHLFFKTLSFFGLAFKKLYLKNNKLKLNKKDYKNIILFIEVSYLLDSNLKDKIFIDIRKLKILKGYKGFRHIYSLPVNGQRTKTNAKICKKKRK